MKKLHPGIFAATCIASLTLFANSAWAEVTIVAREIGGNVVFTFSGSLNPGTGTPDDEFGKETRLDPSGGQIESWQTTANTRLFGLDAVVSFGSGGDTGDVGEGTGTNIAIFDNGLFLDNTYTPGDPINSTLTFSGTTFAGLGVAARVTPYVWTITETGDTISLRFPDEIAAAKAKIRKQIRNLKKKIRVAKQNGQNSKARRLQKKVRKLKLRLRRLNRV